MSRLRTALTTTAILAGSSAALLTGGIANAEPAPAPVVPQIPGLSVIQSLPAVGPQLLQAASQVLTGPAAAPVAPAVPPALATATVNLPAQPAAATAGIPGLTPATGIPGLTPATAPAITGVPGYAPGTEPVAAPATAATSELIPSGDINLPSIPGLPIPLPQRISFPGALTSLLPGATPAAPVAVAAPAIAQPGIAPAASATSPLPGIGALFPAYALP